MGSLVLSSYKSNVWVPMNIHTGTESKPKQCLKPSLCTRFNLFRGLKHLKILGWNVYRYVGTYVLITTKEFIIIVLWCHKVMGINFPWTKHSKYDLSKGTWTHGPEIIICPAINYCAVKCTFWIFSGNCPQSWWDMTFSKVGSIG